MSTNIRPISFFEQVATAHPEWPDKRVVIHICERLLDEGQIKPPVNVEMIASLCGIQRVEYRSAGPAGMLVCQDEAWVASVLAADGRERQRFSICHEGGHTLQRDFKRGDLFHRCLGPRTPVELLCDVAAAEFLLPRRFFVADLLAAGGGLDAVEELAHAYIASLEATVHRVIDLSMGPLAMIVFQMAHKPADRGLEEVHAPKLRVDYTYSNNARVYAPKHKSVESSSPFGRAWSFEPVDELVDMGAPFTQRVDSCSVSARRYGEKVIAIVGPATKTAAG